MTTKIISKSDKKEHIVELNRSGENLIVCPVCSDSRKAKHRKLKCLGFNRGLGKGRCNHCEEAFYIHADRQEKQEVVYKRPEWKNKTQLSERLVKWFENERKLRQETLNHFRISEGVEWMPQDEREVNTVQFNYFHYDELINIKYRTGNKHFKLHKDAELIFYNIDAVIGEETVIICEGEIDCMTIHQCGYKNVISVPNGAGSTNLSYLDSAIELFEDDTKFLLAVDNDEAGIKLEKELVRRLGSENCKRITFLSTKDANECMIKLGEHTVRECIENAKEYPLVGVFSASDLGEEIDDYYNNGMPEGCDIGIPEFDELLKFHKGYMTCITGIPNLGKTTFMDYLMCKLNVLHGWKFAVYSPESWPMQLHFSVIAEKLVGKTFNKKYSNRMSKEEMMEAKSYFDKNFFLIAPPEDFTLDNILSTVRQLIRKHGISAFIIDAWNTLDHKYSGDETKYISEQLSKLSLFCQVNNVHFFLIAHPRKMNKTNGEWEVPNLYSINGSAAFFNKFANGICVHRDNEGAKIHIQKVKFKHWGKQGNITLQWDWYSGRYFSFQKDESNWINTDRNNVFMQVEQTRLPQQTIDKKLSASDIIGFTDNKIELEIPNF